VGVNWTAVDPPREFEVGFGERLVMKDCARVRLEPDEQVTFTTEAGAEYDVARKAWGFYATPSLNGRMQQFGLRGVLIRNRIGRYFVILVERGREAAFEHYLQVEGLVVVCWLDSTEALQRLETGLMGLQNG
jgi:hypothetical protein